MGIGAAIIGAAVSAFGVGTTIFGLGAFGSFLAMSAIGIALNALTPKPKVPSNIGSGSQANRGYTVNQRGSALDHQIIYGRMRVGGVIVFRGVTGTNNKLLHEVVAYAGHEIESFDEIWINDAKVTSVDGSGGDTCIKIHDSSDYSECDAWSGCNGGRGYSSFTKYRACDDYAAALLTEISPGLIFNSFPGNRER